MNTHFSGVALVTGAASGIGAAVSHAFALAGCTRLIITDLNETLLDSTKASILSLSPNSTIVQVPGDISDPAFVDHLFALIASTPPNTQSGGPWDRLDYAVNCAGVLGNNQPSTETSLEDFDRINNINYRGLWLCSRAELKIMMSQEIRPYDGARSEEAKVTRGQRGSIVNIASQLGIVGRPDAPAYSASKAAVISLTRSDAIDYSKHSIRINAICPGVISTPMTTSTPERIGMLRSAVDIAPMKRMGLPEEIADLAVWLSGGGASFMQGAQVVCDGGYIIS